MARHIRTYRPEVKREKIGRGLFATIGDGFKSQVILVGRRVIVDRQSYHGVERFHDDEYDTRREAVAEFKSWVRNEIEHRSEYARVR